MRGMKGACMWTSALRSAVECLLLDSTGAFGPSGLLECSRCCLWIPWLLGVLAEYARFGTNSPYKPAHCLRIRQLPDFLLFVRNSLCQWRAMVLFPQHLLSQYQVPVPTSFVVIKISTTSIHSQITPLYLTCYFTWVSVGPPFTSSAEELELKRLSTRLRLFIENVSYEGS